MAGGNFDKLTSKTLPGTYINFESGLPGQLRAGERGKVLLPLLNHNWGPARTFITLSAAAPDAETVKLGYSIADGNVNMLLIREAFKRASQVIVYIPCEGTKATASQPPLTATAKYGGSRGNDLRYSITANPLGGFDVTVFLANSVVSAYSGLDTAEALAARQCPYIDFTGTGALEVTAGVSLSGGSNATVSNGDITDMLDAAEGQDWNTLAFPLPPESDNATALFEAVKSCIKTLRSEAGKYRKAVVPCFHADYEGIINVTNGVVLADGTPITPAMATAFVAGMDAGASHTQSNTERAYDGAVDVLNPKNHAQAVDAVNKGEFFFTRSAAGDIVVQYDINSLTSFDKPKDENYRKNRVLRVLDVFAETLMLSFPPNRFDNGPTGWAVMEGLGRAMLRRFADEGAIRDVNYADDFQVDRGRSAGDETYFNVLLMPADSAEKLYFTITTR